MIAVKDTSVKTLKIVNVEYVCITDITCQKNEQGSNSVVANWMCNRNTKEFLGIWETKF